MCQGNKCITLVGHVDNACTCTGTGYMGNLFFPLNFAGEPKTAPKKSLSQFLKETKSINL
jgi:hypothetical protein